MLKNMSIYTLEQSFKQLSEKSLNTTDNVNPGFFSGWGSLDDVLGQFIPNNIYLVMSRPSIGKTTFLTNLAFNLLKDTAGPVLFITPRISGEAITRLFLDLDKNWKKKNPEGKERLEKELLSLPLYIDDTRDMDIRRVMDSYEAMILAWENLHITTPIPSKARRRGVIIFDDFDVICTHPKRKWTLRKIEKVLTGLRAVSEKLNIPIILSSTTGDLLEKRITKMPFVDDLEWNYACLHKIDRFLMLHREEVYSPRPENKNILEVRITDNRVGATYTALLEKTSEGFRLRDKPQRE